jgi:hypothetical protein
MKTAPSQAAPQKRPPLFTPWSFISQTPPGVIYCSCPAKHLKSPPRKHTIRFHMGHTSFVMCTFHAIAFVRMLQHKSKKIALKTEQEAHAKV